MLYISVLTGVAAFFSNLGMFIYVDNMLYTLKVEFFRECLKKDGAFYDKNSPSEMPSIVKTEIDNMRNGFGTFCTMFTRLVATFTAGFIFSLLLDAKMTLYFMIITPVSCLALGFLIGVLFSV